MVDQHLVLSNPTASRCKEAIKNYHNCSSVMTDVSSCSALQYFWDKLHATTLCPSNWHTATCSVHYTTITSV